MQAVLFKEIMKDGESLWRSYRFFWKYDIFPKSGEKYGCKPTAQEKETTNLSLCLSTEKR